MYMYVTIIVGEVYIWFLYMQPVHINNYYATHLIKNESYLGNFIILVLYTALKTTLLALK